PGSDPILDGLPASPSPGSPSGPGAGQSPPDSGDCTRVFALYRVWHRATGLGTGNAGPGRGWPGADAPGPGDHLGHGADAGAAALSGPARGGRRVHWPGGGGTTPVGLGPGSTGV